MRRNWLKHKVALVTGGASGIGEALATQLVAAGAKVVIADRDEVGARGVAARLGPDARAVALDVADAEAFQKVADGICDREGGIDLLFNNAGVGLAGAVQDHELSDWDRVINVNIWGVINGVQAVYGHMIRQGSGHIVNTASGAALAPRPGMTGYAMTKHAVVGLTISLRPEAELHGVRVSAVCPGYIATNIQKSTRFVKLDGAKLMEKVPIKPLSAAQCAQITLEGVRRNKAIIPVSRMVWLDWILYRLSPNLSLKAARWRSKQFDAHRTR